MPDSNFISVKEASERYGYSGSHIRNLLSKGVIEGEKFASVWLVDPRSIEKHRTQMEQLGFRTEDQGLGLSKSSRPGCFPKPLHW